MSIGSKTAEIAKEYFAFIRQTDNAYIGIEEYLLFRNAAIKEIGFGTCEPTPNQPVAAPVQTNLPMSNEALPKEEPPSSSIEKEATPNTLKFQAPKRDKKQTMLDKMRAFDS